MEITKNSSNGVLFEQVKADKGLIERPMFAPHFQIKTVAPNLVFLVSETSSHVLQGELYQQLAKIIDGKNTRQEIHLLLADQAKPLQIDTALVHLATKGYIVATRPGINTELAAFWTSLGITPTHALNQLQQYKVQLVNFTNRLNSTNFNNYLEAFNIPVTTNSTEANLYLVLVDDYLQPELAEFNENRLQDKKPWLLLRPHGIHMLIGPVFQEQQACWDCLAHRLAANQEVKSFLNYAENKANQSFTTTIQLPGLQVMAINMATIELAKWLLFREHIAIHNHVVSYNVLAGNIQNHSVTKRPQCFTCGDPQLYLASRHPNPIKLAACPKQNFTSGGMRSVSPQQTLQRYQQHISPISGIVTQLLRANDDKDQWLHTYLAGHNLAIKHNNYRLLRMSLRSKSSGKGSNNEQAQASALCEAVERYSGVFQGNEIRVTKRFVDFKPAEVVHPNELMLFSNNQYANRDKINNLGFRFGYVPESFDEHALIEWTPVWSLTKQCFRYIPTSYLYFSYPYKEQGMYCSADSNGAASGNTLEEAIVQGFLELVERDCFAIWWYNKLRMPAVDLTSFDDSYLNQASSYYESVNRKIWLLDITNDFNIPTFVAVSYRTDKPVEDILFAAGAHFNPRLAALRAVTELNQYLPAVINVDNAGNNYAYDDTECLWWWKNAKLCEQQYLLPATDLPLRTANDYPQVEQDDFLADINQALQLVKDKGMEMLVLDQTRPDIGMPVAKVLVPGMRHFWARFAQGRLYDVPVQLNWLKKPLQEEELNPIAVFI